MKIKEKTHFRVLIIKTNKKIMIIGIKRLKSISYVVSSCERTVSCQILWVCELNQWTNTHTVKTPWFLSIQRYQSLPCPLYGRATHLFPVNPERNTQKSAHVLTPLKRKTYTQNVLLRRMRKSRTGSPGTPGCPPSPYEEKTELQ